MTNHVHRHRQPDFKVRGTLDAPRPGAVEVVPDTSEGAVASMLEVNGHPVG